MPLIVHSDSCCDVCLGYYEWHDADMHPHAIACGHIFCKGCLSRISSPVDNPSISNAPCPLCRKLFTPGRMKKLHVDRQQPGSSALPEEMQLLLRLAESYHEKVSAAELKNAMEESNSWLEGRPTEENIALRRLVASIIAHNALREAHERLVEQLDQHSIDASRTLHDSEEAGRQHQGNVQKLEIELDTTRKELERVRSNSKGSRRKGYIPPALPAPPQPIPDEHLPEFLRYTLLPNSPEQRAHVSAYLSKAYPSPASPEDRPTSRLPETTMPGGYFSPTYPEYYELGFADSPLVLTARPQENEDRYLTGSTPNVRFADETEPDLLDTLTDGYAGAPQSFQSLRWDFGDLDATRTAGSRSVDDYSSHGLARIDPRPEEQLNNAQPSTSRRGSTHGRSSSNRRSDDGIARPSTSFQPDTRSHNPASLRPVYTGPESIYAPSPLASPVQASPPPSPRLRRLSLPGSGSSFARLSLDFSQANSDTDDIYQRVRTISNVSASSWGTGISNSRSTRSSNSLGMSLLGFQNGNGAYAPSGAASRRSSRTSLSNGGAAAELFPGGLDNLSSLLAPSHGSTGRDSTRNSTGSHQGAPVHTIAEEPDSLDESDPNRPRYATFDPIQELSRSRSQRSSGSRSHRRSWSNPVQPLLQPMQPVVTDMPLAPGPTRIHRAPRVPTRRAGSGSSDLDRETGRAITTTDSTAQYASYADMLPDETRDHYNYVHLRQPAQSPFRAELHQATPPPMTTTNSSSSSDTITPGPAHAPARWSQSSQSSYDRENSLGLELDRSFGSGEVDLALEVDGMRISQPRPVSGAAGNSLRLMNANEGQRAVSGRHPQEVRVTENLW